MSDRLTQEALDEIRRLAGQATPGPWAADGEGDVLAFPASPRCVWVAKGGDGAWGYLGACKGPDAAYLASVSPDVVLRLLDEIGAHREAEHLGWRAL